LNASDRTLLSLIHLTPPGRGAIATLRVEGPGAAEAVQAHFQPHGGRPFSDFPADHLAVGRFGGPRGEELVVRRCPDGAVELHCHGGRAAVAAVEEVLVASDCREVSWADWSAGRATDPIAAEALRALADAPTQRTAAILLDQYHGALHRAFQEIESCIAQGRRDDARGLIEILRGRAVLGLHLVRPWSVVLAGRVNVGKSSLMNALAGYGRSIVHDSPGTTRDAVTLTTAVDGWPVELCDTAGWRDDGGDPIERAGMALARERLERADLILLIFDASQPWSPEDQSLIDRWPRALIVQNKCDLLGDNQGERGTSVPGNLSCALSTSALRGDGIATLLETIARRLVPDPPPPGAAVPFRSEHVERLERLSTVR